MNFQYIEGFDSDSLHFNLHSTEKVMNLEQKEIKKREKIEEKEFHQETSEEGLVLKQMPSHLKYAYLELPKNKPIIISARISDVEEQFQTVLGLASSCGSKKGRIYCNPQ